VKTVFVAENPAQAHIVAGLLEEADIRCVVEGEMLFGIRGDLGLTPASLPKISVRDEDAARAADLIRAREGSLARARAEEDEDAAPAPKLWSGMAKIAALWLLVGIASAAAMGPVALPFVAVCLFVHVYLHFDRAS
jgi:hypothetical protein